MIIKMPPPKNPRKRTCANCSQPAMEEYTPFCSRRCADIDLGRWLNESYTIPAVEPPDEWSEEE
jgi:endogenous inhibitor of DNA gyrase (YacG/DUF329 family)